MIQTLAKYRHLFILTSGLIIAFWLLYVLRSVVFPFVIGLLLAYLLLPVVARIERGLFRFERRPSKAGKWAPPNRVFAIAVIYIIFLVLLASFVFYIGTTLIHSISTLIANAPQTTMDALNNPFSNMIRGWFPAEVRGQIDSGLIYLGTAMGSAVKDVINQGIALLPITFTYILGVFTIPFFLFYLLKDWGKLKEGFYSGLPVWAAEHGGNVLSIIGKVMGRYVRAQLLCGLVVGAVSFIGFSILRIPFAPALALFSGATEMVPIVGPWIGGITAIIVSLAFAPDKVVWVAVVALSVQLLENTFLVPRIQGSQLNIHPAIAMVLLVVGAYVAGFWGLLVILPLTATIFKIYQYIHYAVEAENSRDGPVTPA